MTRYLLDTNHLSRNDLILLTTDQDFLAVPNLKQENWRKGGLQRVTVVPEEVPSLVTNDTETSIYTSGELSFQSLSGTASFSGQFGLDGPTHGVVKVKHFSWERECVAFVPVIGQSFALDSGIFASLWTPESLESI